MNNTSLEIDAPITSANRSYYVTGALFRSKPLSMKIKGKIYEDNSTDTNIWL